MEEKFDFSRKDPIYGFWKPDALKAHVLQCQHSHCKSLLQELRAMGEIE